MTSRPPGVRRARPAMVVEDFAWMRDMPACQHSSARRVREVCWGSWVDVVFRDVSAQYVLVVCIHCSNTGRRQYWPAPLWQPPHQVFCLGLRLGRSPGIVLGASSRA